MGAEIFLVLELAWLTLFLGSSVKLVRAQTPQEHDSAMRILVGCIIGAILIVTGPPVAMWITGLKTVTLRTNGTTETFYYTGADIPGTARGATRRYADLSQDEKDRTLPAGTGRIIDVVINLLRIVGGVAVTVGFIWGGISLRARRDGRQFRRSACWRVVSRAYGRA